MCASEVIVIGSYNSVSPGRHQANIWTNAGILLFGPLGINFNEILIEIKNSQENAFEIVVCKMTSISSQPHWVILHDLPLAIVPPLLPVTDTRNWFRVARHAWSTQFLDHPRVYFGQAASEDSMLMDAFTSYMGQSDSPPHWLYRVPCLEYIIHKFVICLLEKGTLLLTYTNCNMDMAK